MSVWVYFVFREVTTIKNQQTLKNLIFASLLSNGEINKFNLSDTKEMIVPFQNGKSVYLFNYLKSNHLMDVVRVEPIKEQFKITLTPVLLSLVNEWYKDETKIFKKRIGITELTYESIIIAINLFGVRKLEGVSISTNIDNHYLKTVAYCIKIKLNIEVIIGKNQFKFMDVPELFLKTMDKISTIDSSEMANLLTKQEKNKLKVMKGEPRYE